MPEKGQLVNTCSFSCQDHHDNYRYHHHHNPASSSSTTSIHRDFIASNPESTTSRPPETVHHHPAPPDVAERTGLINYNDSYNAGNLAHQHHEQQQQHPQAGFDFGGSTHHGYGPSSHSIVTTHCQVNIVNYQTIDHAMVPTQQHPAPMPASGAGNQNSSCFNRRLRSVNSNENGEREGQQQVERTGQVDRGQSGNQLPVAPISSFNGNINGQSTPPEKIIQRVKANNKERRRTQSINQAFSELRRHIPDVPSDTKLSKIKTLRLAISYISHLMSTLDASEPSGAPDVMHNGKTACGGSVVVVPPALHISLELQPKQLGQKSCLPSVAQNQTTNQQRFNIFAGCSSSAISLSSRSSAKTFDEHRRNKDRKHRTGWPEIVWKSHSTSSSSSPSSNNFNQNNNIINKRLDPIHQLN